MQITKNNIKKEFSCKLLLSELSVLINEQKRDAKEERLLEGFVFNEVFTYCWLIMSYQGLIACTVASLNIAWHPATGRWLHTSLQSLRSQYAPILPLHLLPRCSWLQSRSVCCLIEKTIMKGPGVLEVLMDFLFLLWKCFILFFSSCLFPPLFFSLCFLLFKTHFWLLHCSHLHTPDLKQLARLSPFPLCLFNPLFRTCPPLCLWATLPSTAPCNHRNLSPCFIYGNMLMGQTQVKIDFFFFFLGPET